MDQPITGAIGAGVLGTTAVPVVEVGGSHVSSALVGPDGEPPRIRGLNTAPLDGAAPAEEILDALLRCARAIDARPGSHWAVALPGPFDYVAGVAWYRGVAKFDALYGFDVGRALRTGLGAAADTVVFVGDAEAFTLGEWIFGGLRSHRRIVGVTLGTGIGSSFLADGVAVTDGPRVPPAGRVDLLTIDGKPLEDTVSTRAILARYGNGREATPLSVAVIADRARTGEERAAGVLDGVFTALGAALAPWLRSFGAEAVVVGGAMARSWDLVAGPLRRGLASDVPADLDRSGWTLTAATHIDDAALLGAAHRAIRPVH